MLAMTYAPDNKDCIQKLISAIEKDSNNKELKESLTYLTKLIAGEKCIIAIKAIKNIAHFVINIK